MEGLKAEARGSLLNVEMYGVHVHGGLFLHAQNIATVLLGGAGSPDTHVGGGTSVAAEGGRRSATACLYEGQRVCVYVCVLG